MKYLDSHLSEKIKIKFYDENVIKNSTSILCAEANVGGYNVSILKEINKEKYSIETELNRKFVETYDSEKAFALARDINYNIPIMYREKNKGLKQFTFDRFISGKLRNKSYGEEVLKTILVITIVGEIGSFDLNSFDEKLKSFCLYLIQCLEEKDIEYISKNIKNTRGTISFGA